jgi:hypothetical protein
LKHSTEFQALEIDKVDENALTWGKARRDASGTAFPTRRMRLPLEDLSQVAVLSWRWDVDEQTGVSRNVAGAIRQAREIGVRHLFMDLVSIDQNLRGDELLKHVVAFSALYECLPVIAAYDRDGANFRMTMRRPWILREARAFRANPNRVIYVGHNGQGTHRDQFHEGIYAGNNLLGELSKFAFGDMLERIWRSSFTHTILGVLCDEIGMYSVSDFRFILPEHARILTAAHGQMSRNDYLLTAAILSHVYATDSKVNSSSDISPVKFGRYTRSAAPGGTYDSNEDIFLDGSKVATWLHHYNLATSNHHCRLEVMPNAERTIFAALGLSEAEYQEYALREEQRRLSLLLPQDDGAPLPRLEVVSMTL